MQLQANSSIIHQLSWQTSLHSAHKTWMSLSWVNDRVGGPCQPGAWTRALPTLQFTPSGQRGRGERRKDEVDDRRNEAVTQMSAKTKGQPGKCYQTDLTTERGALSMTFLWEMKLKKKKKNSTVSLSNTWFLTLCVNLNDTHSFFIQAMLQNRHFTKANTGLPNFTICMAFSRL